MTPLPAPTSPHKVNPEEMKGAVSPRMLMVHPAVRVLVQVREISIRITPDEKEQPSPPTGSVHSTPEN